MRTAGHDYEKVISGRGRPFGLFTKGRRPKLKEMSGQEKLPVLQLPDGTTIAGSSNIVAWASSHPPGAEPAGTAQRAPLGLIEFPADEPQRAVQFWSGLLDVALEAREGGGGSRLAVALDHPSGRRPRAGARARRLVLLALLRRRRSPEDPEQVEALGGSIVHPGESWAICKDSEGSPFGLAG